MDQGPFADHIQFGEPLGEQISFVSLKNQIHTHLLAMEKLFKDEDISHIYEQLFDVSSQEDDPSLGPSAPLYHDEPESAQRVQVGDESTLPLDRSIPPPQFQPVDRSKIAQISPLVRTRRSEKRISWDCFLSPANPQPSLTFQR